MLLCASITTVGGLALAPVGASPVAPAPPELTDTAPGSPANDNSPRVLGTAPMGSTVHLYTSADCSGAPAATGSAAELAAPGLGISVPDDSTTHLHGTATDSAGDVSDCSSSSTTYVEDSTPPAPPRPAASNPGSPANQNSPKIKGSVAARPWFLYLAPTAPHGPFTPEPKYQDAPVPEFVASPAFFEDDRSDKPPYVRQADNDPAAVVARRTAQLRTLMSVDDLVAKVFSALEDAGETDDTLAFFVSDNGYLDGEHGLVGKPHPYTHSAKIPFFMRWPARLGGGVEDQRLVANIDLASTIMDAIGLSPDASVDGASLLDAGSRDRILLEFLFGGVGWHVNIPTWASIRAAGYQYTEYYEAGAYSPDRQPVFREYYDLRSDPWQLTNYLGDANPANDPPPATLDALHDQLASDLRCAGRDGFGGRPACGPTTPPPGPAEQGRPNVLVIVTDDQRPTETLEVMPKTRERFGDQGIYFPNAFATTPLCCPARASILTGRFAHNHRVRANHETGFLDHSTTIERRLQQAGYRTGTYGKLLNAWPLSRDPPYFDQWSVFNNGPYTDFEANEQGQVKSIAEYATTYVADKAAQFIRQQEDDNSTIRLYRAPTAADCTPAHLAATGSAAAFGSPGLSVSVPDNSTTRFRATATDEAGNTSACSASSLLYREDSAPPARPTFTTTDPGSPANHNSPRVRGAAEAGATVRLYKAPTTADCTPSNLAATGTAAAFASPGIGVWVDDDSTTRFRATARDAAGNTSACSTGSLLYREDSTPPPGPTFSGTDPVSPANDNTPRVKGTAPAGTTVRLYKAPTIAYCTPARLAATGTPADFASPGIEVSVPDDSTTRFRATATDAAGNTSVCSAGSRVYVENSSLAPIGAGMAADPAAGSPLLTGPLGATRLAGLLAAPP